MRFRFRTVRNGTSRDSIGSTAERQKNDFVLGQQRGFGGHGKSLLQGAGNPSYNRKFLAARSAAGGLASGGKGGIRCEPGRCPDRGQAAL